MNGGEGSTTPVRAGAGAASAVVRFLSPALVWAVVLILSPMVEPDRANHLVWGIGAAVLVCFVPWAIVTWLDKRNDLRRGISRLGVTPVVLAAGALMYMTLRVIRWLDGPLGLAAAIFAIFAGYAVLLLLGRVIKLDWTLLTYAGAAVVLVILLGWPGVAALAVLALASWVRSSQLLRRNRIPGSAIAVSLVTGAVVCGGTYAALLRLVP